MMNTISVKNKYRNINEDYLSYLILSKKKQIKDTIIFFFFFSFIIIIDLILVILFKEILSTRANIVILICILILNIVTIFILSNHCSLFYTKILFEIYFIFIFVNLCNISVLIYKNIFLNFLEMINYIGRNKSIIGFIYFSIMLYVTINISFPISTVFILRRLTRVLINYDYYKNNNIV